MALTMAEFQAFGKKPVLSPEETVTAEAYYQEHRQMNGLGQAHSGDYRDGLNRFGRLGAAPVTVMWGAGERDPQDLRTPGAGFRSAVAPGAVSAALSRPRGGVGFARRVQLTRLVEELEALVGTAGVHPQILAQKAWDLRRALVGAGDWSWADYTDPRQAYDDKHDLEQRLLVIERLLGIGRLAPALAGMGGLGAWNQPYYDPVAKLASCIRGALCMPKSFCCPPGSKFRPPARDRAEQEPDYAPVSNSVLVADQLAEPRPPTGDTWVQPPPGDTWVQPPPGGPGDTWTQPPPGGPSDQQILPDPYAAAKANRARIASAGGADANLLNDAFTRNKAAAEAAAAAAAKAAADARAKAQQAKEQADAQAKLQAQMSMQPAPAPAVAVGQPGVIPFTSMVPPKTPEQNQWAAMQQNIRDVLKRSMTGRTSGGTANRIGGLGASSLTSMPEINALRAKLRQARIEIARRRA